MKGLPSGYNKDLQEDKDAVFDAEDTLTGCLTVVRAVVAGLTLNRDRAGAAASGLLLATDVADYLVGAACRSGAPTRSSVRWCASCSPRAAISSRCRGEEWRQASELFGADVGARITPRRRSRPSGRLSPRRRNRFVRRSTG